MQSICIVDEDEKRLEVLRKQLINNYRVSAYLSGEQLNEHLIGEEKPDLILLSYTLTDENSVELLRTLQKREDAKRIPVIVMTDSLEPAMEGECMEAGAEDFLPRPLNFQIAHSRIDRIIELNTLKEELQEALKDPLTGMCNRNYAENQINAYLKDHQIGAYFMIDLDNFKQVNDAFGHVAGDNILKEVADILVRAVGKDGIACRMGGDEFSLFFYRENSRARLSKIAVNILNEYNRMAVENDSITGTSLSIGISIAGKDGKDYAELYNAADKALYFSKRNGKNSYYFYGKAVNLNQEDDHETAVDIHQLERLIQDRKSFAGSYQVDYKEFQRIYNFIERCVERTHQKAQLMLVSLQDNHPDRVSQELLESEIQNLEDSIVHSLRRNDVSTRYSNRQILVVLIDIDEDKMNIVRNRISENYKESRKNDCYTIAFEQMPIERNLRRMRSC